jgi:methionine-rich copper-binding protein CopC/putative copper export protein
MNTRLHKHTTLAAIVALTIALFALTLPSSAAAHPALLQSAPSAGVISPDPVEEVEIVLSEPAVADGSKLTVRELAGDQLKTTPLKLVGADKTMIVKPAEALGEGTYEVDWSALGADGHLVSGKYAFGVAGKDGQAPQGAQALASVGGKGGRGGEQQNLEGAVTVVARWMLIIAGSFLLGGFLLLERLLRVFDGDRAKALRDRWRSLAPPVALLLAFAVSELVIANATAGAGDGFDAGTLFSSPTGKGVVAQAVLAVLTLLAIPVLASRERARDSVLAIGGTGILIAQALTGHVQTLDDGVALAALLQVLHVLSASIWLGGLITLLLIALPGEKRPLSLADAARSYAPIAAGALLVAVVTGVLAAFREVDDIYFLRWSSYGVVVIVKAALVLIAAAIGGFAFLRSRRSGAPERLMRLELVAAVTVAVLAVVLSGLVPGRGQPLPAQRGTLLPGPALASAVERGGPLRVTLAPALSGTNTFSVVQDPVGDDPIPPQPTLVSAKLFCDCSKDPVQAKLSRDGAGVWSSTVDLPDDGSWYARLDLDGKASTPVALPVGVPQASGPGPLDVLSVADLSGPDATKCRSHLLGLQLAIGRINAVGGLDGGRKVTLLALDDENSPEKAAEVTKQAIADRSPIALAAPCGGAASAAVKVAGDAGLPTIVGDPAVAPVQAERDFRLAPDPYAEGCAQGQYLKETIAPEAKSTTIHYADVGDEIAARRLQGLRDAIADSKLSVDVFPVSKLADPATLRPLVDVQSSLALVADSLDSRKLASELNSLGDATLPFAATPVIAGDRVLSEDLVNRSGALGRIGAVQGPTELQTDSSTAQSYAAAVPALYPGERPTLDGLRGYLAGLALTEGLKHGIEPGEIADGLVQPPPFSDAVLSPWRSDAPSYGSTQFLPIKAQFLPPTLVPTDKGGESFNGTFFTDGSWTAASTEPLGPSFEKPLPPLESGG